MKRNKKSDSSGTEIEQAKLVNEETKILEKINLNKKAHLYCVELIESVNGFLVQSSYSKGATIVSFEKGPFESRDEALCMFHQIASKKKKEGYKPMKSSPPIKPTPKSAPKSKSKPKKIQKTDFSDDLCSYLFNSTLIEKYLQEKGYDICCNPLSSISNDDLDHSYRILSEIEQSLLYHSRADIGDLSKAYYSKIPHFLSSLKSSILDTPQKITKQVDLLSEIQCFKYLYSTAERPILLSLERTQEIYTKICNSIKSAVELSSPNKSIVIEGICSIFPEKKTSIRSNRKLLWLKVQSHCIPYILANGLSLPPEQAPSVAFELNKGIYFSDNASAVMNDASQCALVLCDVALGNCCEKFNADFLFNSREYDSVKGCGKYYPSSFYSIEEALLAESFKAEVSSIHFLYNVYSVYDVGQVSMKYVVKISQQ